MTFFSGRREPAAAMRTGYVCRALDSTLARRRAQRKQRRRRNARRDPLHSRQRQVATANPGATTQRSSAIKISTGIGTPSSHNST
jgi:hypothetical protein